MERRTMREALKRYYIQTYKKSSFFPHYILTQTKGKEIPKEDEDRRKEVPNPRSSHDRREKSEVPRYRKKRYELKPNRRTLTLGSRYYCFSKNKKSWSTYGSRKKEWISSLKTYEKEDSLEYL